MTQCLAQFEIPSKDLKCRLDHNDYAVTHTHDFWEFVVILDGNYLQEINGKEYRTDPRQAVLIKPTDVHRLPIINEAYTHLNILITCDFLHQACDHLDDDLYDKLLRAPTEIVTLNEYEMKEIRKIVAETDLVRYSAPEKEPLLKKLLLSFILQIVYEKTFFTAKHYPEKVRRVLDVISEPSNIALNVEAIVKKTHYSYSYLARLFKEHLGITLTQYVTAKKMERAYDLLTFSDTPILEIALSVGYSSFSHFMRVFKQTFRTSPGKLRKDYQKNRQA